MLKELLLVMFKPFEEGCDVLGGAINSMLSSLSAIPLIVDKYFVDIGYPPASEIKDDQWYSMEKWLLIFKLISDKTGPHTLLNIGKKIPYTAQFPKNNGTLADGLKSIDIAYHMNHRNAQGQVLYSNGVILEGIGHYLLRDVSNEEAIMVCENPYPCDFDKGIILAMAQKFEPRAIVQHESVECRKNDSNYCIYKVTW